MLTNIKEKIFGYFQPKQKKITDSEDLRNLALARQYRQVTDLFENDQIANDLFVNDSVGYCYYQLTNYIQAIDHLKIALKFNPKDYYSSFFLAVSLKHLNRKSEAIDQFLSCLNQHLNQAREIIDHLFPLINELQDQQLADNKFTEAHNIIKTINSENSYLAEILFYQKNDLALTKEILHKNLFCKFYSAKDLTDKGRGQFISLGQPEKLRFIYFGKAPDTWVDTPHPYVAEISNTTIMSGSSLVLVDDNIILSDTLTHKEYGHFSDMKHDHSVLARRNDALLINPPELVNHEIEEGIMLCGLASNAYGHWFAEFLPKLRFFEQHPRFSQIPIIIDEGMPQSHYDFLKTLVSNSTYILPKGRSVKVKNLLIAPTDTFFPLELLPNHTVPPEKQSSSTIGGLRYFDEKIRKYYGPPKKSNSRIFLSRKNSQWRRLINEPAVIAELKKLDFKVLYVEDYTFEQQVKIFQNADFIIGPNGSAFNNLIFCHPNVKAILLGQENLFNWGGWFGSFMELGYSPQYLSGGTVGNKNEKHFDYTIPESVVVNKVLEMLK
jgi:capsular polysaccharide biosynthesis protein/tetratricopeptide (TPR) repeat protein